MLYIVDNASNTHSKNSNSMAVGEFAGDVELSDREIHDRDIDWLTQSDGKVYTSLNSRPQEKDALPFSAAWNRG